MADVEDDTPMEAASGAAGGAASSGKRFEVKKWNAVSGVCILCAFLRAGLCAFSRCCAAIIGAPSAVSFPRAHGTGGSLPA